MTFQEVLGHLRDPRIRATPRRSQHLLRRRSPTLVVPRASRSEQRSFESFNGRLRDELLNPNCFATIVEARAAATDWLIDYTDFRPHSALGYLTPTEFTAAHNNKLTQQLSAA